MAALTTFLALRYLFSNSSGTLWPLLRYFRSIVCLILVFLSIAFLTFDVMWDLKYAGKLIQRLKSSIALLKISIKILMYNLRINLITILNKLGDSDRCSINDCVKSFSLVSSHLRFRGADSVSHLRFSIVSAGK